MTVIGASSSLPTIPAKVCLLNPQLALRLGGGNWYSCPKAVIWRRDYAPKSTSAAAQLVRGFLCVRDCLFEPINGIGRGNRLANADRLMALV
jgi:hypothetical protein